jgi:hypothetical protein
VRNLKKLGTGFKSHFMGIMLVMGFQKSIRSRIVLQLHNIHKKKSEYHPTYNES